VTQNIIFVAFVFQVRSIGLTKSRKKNPHTAEVIKRLLALQYLPGEHIPLVFRRIQVEAGDAVLMTRLMDYMQDTWISDAVFTPVAWSCFKRVIRTNNDVEGWHRRLNRKCNDLGLNMYLLIKRLHREARLIPILGQMVTQGDVCRRNCPQMNRKNQKLDKAWDDYAEGRITPFVLMKRVR
jgi:hypothetical protein